MKNREDTLIKEGSYGKYENPHPKMIHDVKMTIEKQKAKIHQSDDSMIPLVATNDSPTYKHEFINKIKMSDC